MVTFKKKKSCNSKYFGDNSYSCKLAIVSHAVAFPRKNIYDSINIQSNIREQKD